MTTTTRPTTIADYQAYFESYNTRYRCTQDAYGFSIYELIGYEWMRASFGCASASSPNSEIEAWAIAYKMFNEDYQ